MISLPTSTVFPQALDNQYVPHSSYVRIMRDCGHLEEQRRALDVNVRRELHRSLIYSPSVVINRAAFVSTLPLINAYSSDAPKESLEAVAALLKEGALVPMLYSEDRFTPEDLKRSISFGVNSHGFDALDHLFATQGLTGLEGFKADPAILRNAPEVFRNYFNQFPGASHSWITQVGREVFGDLWSENLAEPFKADMRKVGIWFQEQCENDDLSRDLAYKQFLIRPGGDVARGDYGNPRELTFPFQIKQLLDLRYASNIPDQLGRITFTPDMFPSRTALQDFHHQMYREAGDLSCLAEKVGQAARDLLYKAQNFHTLPALEDLDLLTIHRIRTSQVWHDFIDVQNRLLVFDGNPDSFLDATSRLPNAFANLQEHVAFLTKNRLNAVRARRLRPIVKVAVSAGAGALTWWITGNQSAGLGSGIVAQLLNDHLPEKVTGLAIKLLLNFEDENGKIDRAMSTSIEAVRSRAQMTRKEVMEILAAAGKNAEIPTSRQQTAEIDGM